MFRGTSQKHSIHFIKYIILLKKHKMLFFQNILNVKCIYLIFPHYKFKDMNKRTIYLYFCIQVVMTLMHASLIIINELFNSLYFVLSWRTNQL